MSKKDDDRKEFEDLFIAELSTFFAELAGLSQEIASQRQEPDADSAEEKERRVSSDEGKRRRELFDRLVVLFKDKFDRDEAEIRRELRKLFKKSFDKYLA